MRTRPCGEGVARSTQVEAVDGLCMRVGHMLFRHLCFTRNPCLYILIAEIACDARSTFD
jgi:hypothetical protein